MNATQRLKKTLIAVALGAAAVGAPALVLFGAGTSLADPGALNPQPLPPGHSLNPQPLLPG